MANGPLLFGMLVALAVLIGFGAAWRLINTADPIEARLTEYGRGADSAAGERGDARPGRRWPLTNRLLTGFGLAGRLGGALARADVPLTAAEFALLVAFLALIGVVAGALRGGAVLGLTIGGILTLVPILVLRMRQTRRVRAFAEQLPDVLTLLVGALRAGYGLAQALDVLVGQLSPPASVEFARALRAVRLGLPLQRALEEMADRIGSDDLSMVVTAINVQYETGGNLAQTLDAISETVRERIRMFREIRVLTTQQRFTGFVLAVLPIGLAVAIYFVNPTYMSRLFQGQWVLLPIVAGVLQLIGFLVIRRIVDIEV